MYYLVAEIQIMNRLILTLYISKLQESDEGSEDDSILINNLKEINKSAFNEDKLEEC